MKRFGILLLAAAAALLLLAGCSRKEKPEPERSDPAASSSQTLPEDPAEKPDPQEPEKPEPDPAPAEPEPEEPVQPLEEKETTPRQAYAAALDRLLTDHVFPDGRDDGFDATLYDMSENKFAVLDVDRDGHEELVLQYITTDMAGHRGMILDYDGGEDRLTLQLDEYPAFAFFENGAVLVHWSHNQGKAGAFWPYSLYVYRPELDSYSFVGSVDAWDATIDSENYPKDIDVSGTGFVYYLSTDGAENNVPVDAKVYQDWLSTYVGEGGLVVPEYLNLTEDNIRHITDEAAQSGDPVPAP